MLYLIFNLLSEYRLFNISVFSGNILYLDYIIIANGTSLKHIKSSSFNLSIYLKKNLNQNILISGRNSDWFIIESNFILIHIMLEKSRIFYNLDSLYKDITKEIFLF